jgi:DNA-binding response OmpR family regulator
VPSHAQRSAPQAQAQQIARSDRGDDEERKMQEKKALLVEDDESIRVLARTILQRDGWSVSEAADGPSGLAAATDEQPDVIVLDIGLPGMDGLTVARRLSQDPDTADIPIVFLTAMGTTADQLHGYEAGGVDYLVKPFAASTLTTSVRRIMDAFDSGRSLRRDRVDQVIRLQAILALEQQQ